MKINFGYGREPLHVQMGVKKKEVAVYESILTGIMSANFHGIITAGEFEKALDRLDRKLHAIMEVENEKRN